ncbi:anti-sigma regulatory factor (Ser/Thr protein kinase) [Paraburkholderia bannensis]|uniref:Anti-sigma regulatory factor (Ser/Thr protein kinase) n=1 Tax=Paraburkholderia bannensis TaxID=765414 RepID=A0A7W9TXA5_9BURK|nr:MULTISPECIES: hypothetical protein [Paraburkholderia]MBB3258115.1 anti-sigma regulatory factor (Ser/Thr protein kinase) [Paraburkholderia sp. WP4_3_2]MBB6103128.1 anti-sigma regulatory factor (Ser/Thr protein kinase) [Paraburkholderia bannensis]
MSCSDAVADIERPDRRSSEWRGEVEQGAQSGGMGWHAVAGSALMDKVRV